MMKKMMFIAAVFLLALPLNAVSSYNSTFKYSDTCATLTLSSPKESAAGYFIDGAGKMSSGYSYYAWFFVDEQLYGTNNSFTSTSFARTYGPFTGSHTFKLTMQGWGAMNLCKRTVELTVVEEKKDPKEMAEAICKAIEALPGDAFKNNPEQRENAFCEKIAEVVRLIEEAGESADETVRDQIYQDAIEKLQNDIGAKMDSHAGGEINNDWITDEMAQAPVYNDVQKLIKALQELQ